jgi:hypothetical protein
VYGPANVTSADDSVIGSNYHGRLESGIPLNRLTTICMPMRADTPELRRRPKNGEKAVQATVPSKIKTVFSFLTCDPIAILREGTKTVRHHTQGWLKNDLLATGSLDGTKEALYAKVWGDYCAQLLYIKAQQDILGEDFNPLKVVPGRDDNGKFVFCKNVDVPKNHLSLSYLLYAYDMSQSTLKRLRQRSGEALPKQSSHNKGKSVIQNPEYASQIYTARRFYIRQKMQTWRKKSPVTSMSRRAMQRKRFSVSWDQEKAKDKDFGEQYEKKARDQAVRQKGIKTEIVATLNINAQRSYTSLEKAVNNWCSHKAIEILFKGNPDFEAYSTNVRPLLSEGNRSKQVQFAQHVRNRWGLGEGQKSYRHSIVIP